MSETHSTVDDILSQSVLEQVDAVCDRFEDAWLAGQRPCIEDYLAEVADERVRQALVKELIALDIYHRQKQGGIIPPRDYERFSPLAADALDGASVANTSAAVRYRLGEKIGRGGMGEVHRGRDLRLNRELAIKVLREEHQGETHLQRRFLEEARIGGRLQHPGIVPVHDLGELSDGRPFFTMKLVEGRTLADLLDERGHKRLACPPAAGPTSEPLVATDLPRFLSIFEQICQTLAYAHAQDVIHRDLKPGNVMVGAFGEVQVMDWGLAKILKRSRPEEAAALGETAVYSPTEKETSEPMRTQPGQAMGTYPYMPPEQARGEIERVDERSDVFGLGAILCEILTGRPPFTGRDRSDIFAKSKACDHAEALARLDACGADAELLRLAKVCLAAKAEDRPANAGAVAASVKAYLEGVQERLRAAERERAAAQARAEEAKKTAAAEQARAEEARKAAAAEQARADEARKTVAAERRARRRMVWAALAMLLLIVGAGGGAWWQQWKQEQADRKQEQVDQAVVMGISQAELLAKQAQEAPLELAKYRQALQEARVAADLARGASDAVRARAEELKRRLEHEEAAAERDRRLLTALLEVHEPREGPKFKAGDKGNLMTLAKPSAEEQYASAFRDWGLHVDATPTDEVVSRLKARPPAVRAEVIAALDHWAIQRRHDRKPQAEWRRLAVLAAALDDDPGSLRHELREIMTRDRLLDADRRRLQQLADRIDPVTEPVLGLITLGVVLQDIGNFALAERLLHAALTAHPREVVLYHALGKLRIRQRPSRWAEAVECYRTARALRPDLGLTLAVLLRRSGHEGEALALLSLMVKERPDNPLLLAQQAHILYHQHDLDGAIACYKKALALNPKGAAANTNLGIALKDKGDLDGALACFKKALEANPNLAVTHTNLGIALYHKGDLDGAIACCKKALALEPKDPMAHIRLGSVLHEKHDLDGAIACAKKALELDPKHAGAHYSFGTALHDKGNVDRAIACYQKVLALDPKYDPAHYSLGNALRDKGDLDGAIACYKKAIALDPKNPAAHNNLGIALRDKGDLDGAIACYKKVLALDPKHASTHNNLGAILCDNKGDYDGAISCFRTAIDLDSKSALAHGNLGTALRRKGRVDEAIVAFRKAIELDSKNAVAHRILGNALHDKGDFNGAIACYKKALALDPKYAAALYDLGKALHDKGDLDGAVACYKKAIALDPKYAPAYNNLAFVLATCSDPKLRDPRRAVELAKKAVELTPAEGYCWSTLGEAQYRAGDWKAAVAALKKSMELRKGGNSEDWFFLAMAHWQLGEKEQARQWYDRAVQWMEKNDPKNDDLRRFSSEAAELLRGKKTINHR